MESPDLFDYTSGRWIYNGTLRHSEQHLPFNVAALKRVAAESINGKVEDVVTFKKLAEGGFNRSFEIAMCDGRRVLARIPYQVMLPKHFAVASEVATMDFVQSHGILVPHIYGYSATADNDVGVEYIIMELVTGEEVGEIWFHMSEQERLKLILKIVEMEALLFSIRLPASGSIHYAHDLDAGSRKIEIPGTQRDDTTPEETLKAGAKKEIAFPEKYDRQRYPFQRFRRDIYNYCKQSLVDHLNNLRNYLKIADFLTPKADHMLNQLTIRHPDLQPHNMFVSESFDIFGLIDWQHCSVPPLFLQSGIPKSFQNYGDEESESLQKPQLPRDVEQLNNPEQAEALELFRGRQLHFYYMAATAKSNKIHYRALAYDFGMLRQRLLHHASDPWEGDNVTLKADLIETVRNWPRIAATEDGRVPPCPISYSEEEIHECLRMHVLQMEADAQMEILREMIGVGPEGWVPLDQYETSKALSNKIKAQALEDADSDLVRMQIQGHWPFADQDEEE